MPQTLCAAHHDKELALRFNEKIWIRLRFAILVFILYISFSTANENQIQTVGLQEKTYDPQDNFAAATFTHTNRFHDVAHLDEPVINRGMVVLSKIVLSPSLVSSLQNYRRNRNPYHKVYQSSLRMEEQEPRPDALRPIQFVYTPRFQFDLSLQWLAL